MQALSSTIHLKYRKRVFVSKNNLPCVQFETNS